ncbi:hypothetical protein Hanom_Chr12g01162011 [Helianthus anomalus]
MSMERVHHSRRMRSQRRLRINCLFVWGHQVFLPMQRGLWLKSLFFGGWCCW